ncbi:hypothetical protein BCT49_01430 [Vibrio lentus]|uniref:Uncharacterized protein n=1 Tax=Vibrio lentus TaxID=136468 RepID=A0A2N7KC30_9VIBR|nr:hypothetical protein BCT49_01430 [Vibrio lentus]
MRVLNIALFPPRKPGGRGTHNTGPMLFGIQQRCVDQQGGQQRGRCEVNQQMISRLKIGRIFLLIG